MDIFLSEELQTQPDLSPARNILSLHHTSAWLKQVLGSNMIPLRTKFDTETTVISHRIKERERERVRERFSSSASLLLPSEFTEFRDRQHNTCVGDKSIVFLHLPRKFRAGHLGLLSINIDLTLTLIYSANSSFLRLGEVQMRIYERSFQALLPSAPRGFAARSRVLSHKTK